jgi:predicted nucleic acid-binding Zn ribbon protein
MLSQLRENLRKVRDHIVGLFRLDHDVIDVRLDDASYKLFEDTSHASLKHGARVFEPKRHCLVAVSAERNDERGCKLVRYAHRYLVVPGVRIEKKEGFTLSCRIDYLIYARQRKRILGTCLVKARVVNTHPPFLILLLYKYRVSKPLGVEYFSDEP